MRKSNFGKQERFGFLERVEFLIPPFFRLMELGFNLAIQIIAETDENKKKAY